jgi:tetratricopeptide (TPR) repeat protein
MGKDEDRANAEALTMNGDRLWGWRVAATAALFVIVLAIPLYVIKEARHPYKTSDGDSAAATFVGRDKCVSCHEKAAEKWRGSDHDMAMAVASEATVRGDFNNVTFEHKGVTSRFYRRDGRYFVETEGPRGEMAEFEIAYTFGFEPLQQYLIRFPGGRLQALSIAWDVERQRWFHLYPDQRIPAGDWLHWTRNAQNWNGMCAECHSTNLRKGYDPKTDTYNTTWSEINVSCEACHGPGSRHVRWAEIQPMARPEIENYGLVVRTSGMTSLQQVELCAPCHSRRSEIGDYNHQQVDLLDNLHPTLLDEGLYFADGQIQDEVYEYGSFVQSMMFRSGVRCSDCHDVHSLKLLAPGNALCLRCHRADTYDSYDHHFHQKVYQGKPSDGALCVKCHMPERPYMVIDYRADHSIRVPRPDLTAAIGVPNACVQSGCHNDKPLQWSLDAYTKWYGQARKPHYGTILAAGRAHTPEAGSKLVQLVQNPLYPPIVRATALSLLRDYPSEETTRVISQALADEDSLVRRTAAESLSIRDTKRFTSLLAPLLLDPVRGVRMEAAAQLAGASRDLLKPYQKDALTGALAEYRDAMEHALDFSYAGLNLGNLYTNLGQLDEAEKFYRTALRVDDLYYPAKMNLAVLLNREGRNDEAEKLLREVLEAYPNQHDAAYSLGLLLAEMNRYAEAAEILQRAAQGMPQNARVRYNLGLLLQHLQRDAEAEAELRAALDLEPQNVDYLYALADFYTKRSRLDEAAALAERMIAAQPDNRMGHELKAFIERTR